MDGRNMELTVLLLLTVLAREDMENREIDGALLLLFPILGFFRIPGYISGNTEFFRAFLPGLLPGLLLLGTSVLTREAVGEGDALIFVGMAFVLPGELCIRLLFLSALLAGGTAVWMLVKRHSALGQSFPMVPLILLAMLLEFGAGIEMAVG